MFTKDKITVHTATRCTISHVGSYSGLGLKSNFLVLCKGTFNSKPEYVQCKGKINGGGRFKTETDKLDQGKANDNEYMNH